MVRDSWGVIFFIMVMGVQILVGPTYGGGGGSNDFIMLFAACTDKTVYYKNLKVIFFKYLM